MRAHESLDVLAVGESMVMVTPERGGGLNSTNTFVLRAGGAESNVANLMSQLGHSTAWASRLGDDPFGSIIIDALTEVGVDVSLVERTPLSRTGVYFKDASKAETTVYYYRDRSAAAHMDAGNAEHWRESGARLVHLSGVTPALSEGCRRLVRHLLTDRPIGRAQYSFDVNYRPKLWPRGREEAATELLYLAQSSDIVFVGRDEAESLWGTSTAEAIRDLIDKPATLIVKDGSIEAVSFTNFGVAREPSRKVEVVDPVGAGDAFAAGWLSGHLHGLTPAQCLRKGHSVASVILGSSSDTVILPPAAQMPDLATDHIGTGHIPVPLDS